MSTMQETTETFPDGSTITTDESGNRTVCGAMAHKAYFARLADERIYSDKPAVAVVAWCRDLDGTRKAELIRRRNTNPITAAEFGPWGWEVWTSDDPANVIRCRDEQSARRHFRATMVHGTNGFAV
jgi:hypothetical protein